MIETMHTIRMKASRAASSRGEDGALNYNPFARVRARQSVDLENQLHSAPRLEAADADASPLDKLPAAAEALELGPLQAPPTGAPPGGGDEEGILPRPSVFPPQSILGNEHVTKRAKFEHMFRKGEEDIQEPENVELIFRTERERALKRKIPFMAQVRVVLGAWVNLLFVFVPAGFAVNYTRCSSITIFFINFIAIMPSAITLGFAINELECRIGDKMSALLHMTFGNTVQLITSILLLRSTQIDVLKLSLLGTILSNLLLTTGLSFLLGGLTRTEQYFNQAMAQTISMLLLLAVCSLVIPTASHLMTNTPSVGILSQSRGISFVILVSYVLWLVFQLKTNRAMFEEPVKKVAKQRRTIKEGETIKSIAQVGFGVAAVGRGGAIVHTFDLQDIPNPDLSYFGALVTLTVSVVFVGFNTQFATDSIQSLLQQHGLSKMFLGIVILPLISIDTTSIVMAIKDKMDISIALTLERCMQTSLLIVPLIVLLGWCMDIDEMTLQFEGFPIAALFASIVIVTYVVQEGKSNWLTGALLIKVFIIISLSAFYIH